jgi:hypothetical protein
MNSIDRSKRFFAIKEGKNNDQCLNAGEGTTQLNRPNPKEGVIAAEPQGVVRKLTGRIWAQSEGRLGGHDHRGKEERCGNGEKHRKTKLEGGPAMKRWMALCTTFALMFSFTNAHAQESPPPGAKVAPFPNPQPGSWWVRKTADGERKIELKQVGDGKLIGEVDGREVVYTSEWNALEGPGISTRPGQWFTYSPHLRTLSFPLWEGKSWGGNVMWTSMGSFTGVGNFDVVAKARGWETVKVPAGEFEAIKVEILSQGGRTNIRTICWYAPQAQSFVKCDSSNRGSTYELIAYKVVSSDVR